MFQPKAGPKGRKRASTSSGDYDSDSDSESSPPPAKQRSRVSGSTPARGRKSPATSASRAKTTKAAKTTAKSVVNGNVHGTPAKKTRGKFVGSFVDEENVIKMSWKSQYMLVNFEGKIVIEEPVQLRRSVCTGTFNTY